ncbi:MAG: DMT family transporter [Paludibacterium sp.]|uniref:EamA family transporter n=1 Tax=Paludibacterium sp. TaxID=1917523 RepID=UPI0025E5995A|nr:DMT family transporter [Paludibacterium sp.]MBV8046830.1 DMT family transporter [Paludibacterium sp.]MBV8646867.1 DMT family transporter [Paludibacterium sp.]
MPKQSKRLGLLWIVLAACGYGSMALFARLAYADGVDTTSLLALRFTLAAVVLGVWVRRQRIALPRGKDLWGFAGLGALFASMAWTYFSALHYASSGLVALLVYVYPVMVAVLGALLGLDRFGRAETVALAACAVGLYLLLGQSLHAGSPMGIVLALLSGLLYAIYILCNSRFGQGVHPLGAAWVVIVSAAVIDSLIAAGLHLTLPSSPTGWGALVALACFSSALANSAFLIGLRHVGPTLASVLSTLEPVITVSLGLAFLGESLSPSALAGSALVLSAAAGLALARARAPTARTA